MKTTALVVDDEPLARSRLTRFLVELGVDVVGEGENGEEAVELTKQHKVDVVLLDINMPLKNGLQAAQDIMALYDKAPAIIFCTAYDEYALDAFKIHATAYLLKPIAIDDLKQALDKAASLSQLQINHLLNLAADKKVAPSVSIAKQGQIENYAITDLLYFRAQAKHVFAGTIDNKEVVLDISLKAVVQNYGQYYIRIHRNVIVLRAQIAKLVRDEKGHALIALKDNAKQFSVSRRHLGDVKRSFENKL